MEGGSTVQDMASAKEGGGTGRHVGSHQALYGVQNLMLPTESIVQICFFGVIALHKSRVLDDSNLVKNLPANAGDARSLGQEDPLEEGMVTHSSMLALRILWTE